jgi:DNA-binding MarR family transcriptional regulator
VAAGFDLTDYLPYLLNRAGVRIATAFTREARRHGLNLQMWRVLAALNHRDGQGVGELADTTAIDISTLSRVLDQMQHKRLVLRRRDARDARNIGIWRTAAGRAVTARLLPTALRYEAVALDGFDAREAALLKRMLKRVYGNLDRLNGGEKGRVAQAARPSRRQSAAKQ